MLELALYDERINKTHFLVPGPDGDYGFGGTCFPKDINALINLCNTEDIDCSILSAVWNKNLDVRNNLDWLQKVGRAISIKEKKDAIIKPSVGSNHDGSSGIVIK
jgi:UDP-glucose 6-dehydrogenase